MSVQRQFRFRKIAARREPGKPKASALHCPRCGEFLKWIEDAEKWVEFYRCDSCWSTWEFFQGELLRGRTIRAIAAGWIPASKKSLAKNENRPLRLHDLAISLRSPVSAGFATARSRQ
jgi:predicted RNA-binding Zn-ribbon protein involved in translation (DUF1610 family)